MQSDMYVFPARKFQITTPGNTTFTSIAWMLNRGYVAVGGYNGTIRIMLLKLDQDKTAVASLSPWYSSQQLEGHNTSAQVQLLCWNEVYHKLASADDSGLIIVWMSHGSDESWFEEMINNRQKSVVVSLRWSNDGTRIAIAYEDGQVIVGSVDGNRIWNASMDCTLKKIAWSADDTLLLLGLADGEVHAYDEHGKFLLKVTMLCVESVDMEAALSKDLKKDVIVSMEWYSPTRPCKVPLVQKLVEKGGALTALLPRAKIHEIIDEPYVFRGRVPEDRPSFFVVYQNGSIQLMCNENSARNVSIIRLANTIIIQAQWSPDGKMFAVAGLQMDMPELEQNVLYFFSAYGTQLQKSQLPAGNFAGVAWESSGFRLGALIDTNIFLVIVKYPYKWGYFGKTLVFGHECAETLQQTLIFYETQMGVRTKRYVDNLCCVRTFGDYCMVVFRTDEIGGAYTIQLCDGIGTPVDSQTTRLTPDFVGMNGDVIVLASTDAFTIWRYIFPRKAVLVVGDSSKIQAENAQNKVYYIDQNRDVGEDDAVRRAGRTVDNICALCVGPDFFLISRESGAIHRFSIPDVQQQRVFKLGIPLPQILALNCTGDRLALVTQKHVLKFCTISDASSMNVVAGFERKEVWSVVWDEAKDDTLAIMEKQRLIVVRGVEIEEPINCSGRICQFKDLLIRTVLLDEIVRNPEQICNFHFVDIEVKVMKTIKKLLAAGKTSEAIVLIERHNHPKLWSILVRAALKQMDFGTAEQAFVKLQDYSGIQFLKRLGNIQSDVLKRAEVHIFLGELETAEKIYFENDRRDLAIDMLKRMHDWFRIQQILQNSTGPGDDILVQQAWKQVGDYYMERQNWKAAIKYYEHTETYAKLAKCYLMLDDFDGMEALGKQIPNDSPVLKQLAEIFTNYGLCEQAVYCYLRCNKVHEAFETCIRLNEWDRASELSGRYQLADVQNLLKNYAFQITGNKSKNLAVAQLYRKAANYLRAAKLIFETADDEHAKQASPLRLKKLYVMAALLIEEYHQQSQQRLAKSKGETGTSAAIALEGLLHDDQMLSIDDTKLIEGAWRKAEAHHFFMLSHKQLYQGNFEAAMRTSLTVVEYEDLLDPIETYSFLALSSYLAGYFGVCSKAFMKLELLPNLSHTEQDVYAKLALQIFMKNPPRDDKPSKAECTNCETPLTDFTLSCTNSRCGIRFPTCVASGRPLYDYQFWLCPSCKHRAYESEMQILKFCPLCHHDVS